MGPFELMTATGITMFQPRKPPKTSSSEIYAICQTAAMEVISVCSRTDFMSGTTSSFTSILFPE